MLFFRFIFENLLISLCFVCFTGSILFFSVWTSCSSLMFNDSVFDQNRRHFISVKLKKKRSDELIFRFWVDLQKLFMNSAKSSPESSSSDELQLRFLSCWTIRVFLFSDTKQNLIPAFIWDFESEYGNVSFISGGSEEPWNRPQFYWKSLRTNASRCPLIVCSPQTC